MVEKRPNRPRNPDIELTANVKVRELRFEKVPETEARFPGDPERESVSITDRENLPDKVEPGIVYPNPRVRLQIASALVDSELRKRLDETGRKSKRERARRKK